MTAAQIFKLIYVNVEINLLHNLLYIYNISLQYPKLLKLERFNTYIYSYLSISNKYALINHSDEAIVITIEIRFERIVGWH